MKNINAFRNGLVILLIFSFLSCKKNSSISSTDGSKEIASIIGRWDVINLTSSLSNSEGLEPYLSDYTGIPGDYFEFKIDGTVVMHLGQKQIASKYVVSNHSIIFSYAGLYSDTLAIEELSNNRATFSVKKNLPLGQVFNKTEALQR